jgi:CheY-like chemotaxis protein
MESAEAKMSSAALPPNLSDGLCLLLHADNQQRASLSEFLKMLVAQTVSASSYADCASVLKSKSPHIIIVDAFSLGLDESQLLTLLRTDPILKCTPVVLISQTASEQHMLSLIEAGTLIIYSFIIFFFQRH